MPRVHHLVFVLSGLLLGPGQALAHSDASMFGGPASGADHHDHPEEAATRYPATLSIDTRRLVNLTIKINARITGLNNLYVGKKVAKGEVLGEMESAELETVQTTYLALFANMDAVQSFSMTANEKMIDARMNLLWRGMSDQDIEQMETTREPLKRIRIKAPVSGFLYALNVVNNQILNTGGQVGQYTATGTTIATIARPDAVQVETDLPVSEASRLKPGQAASVHISDARIGQVAIPAVVQRVFAFANPNNQRQRVRLKLTGRLPDGLDLLAGLLASVSLEGAAHAH